MFCRHDILVFLTGQEEIEGLSRLIHVYSDNLEGGKMT